MRILPLCAVALSLLPRPGAAQSWDVQFNGPIDPNLPVAIRSLDPDEVTADLIATLRDRPVMPICYVSVGTTEDWRSDADAFPPDLIGNPYEDWPGESFLDIRDHARLLPIMRARFARCADMGFSGIEADNIDLNWADTGFDLSDDDVVAYVAALAQMAHGMGLTMAQKNAPDLTDRLAPLLDFAITEDCLADGWCGAMAPYAETYRPILAIEYSIPKRKRPGACNDARTFGLSVVFKTRDLGPYRSDCRDY